MSTRYGICPRLGSGLRHELSQRISVSGEVEEVRTHVSLARPCDFIIRTGGFERCGKRAEVLLFSTAEDVCG